MKYIILFCILLILLLIFTFIYNLVYVSHYDKIYLINLERRKDRLKLFNKSFNNSDINEKYNLYKAVDGKTINLKDVVDYKTMYEILNIEKTKKRDYHYQLSKGAVGCYLSHINIWKKVLNSRNKQVLIFEDDIKIPNNFNELLNKQIKYIPNDYDIILLGYICNDCIKYKNYIKINKFWGMHAYIITKKNIKKIYNKMFPITQQIDAKLSDLSNEINIYGFKHPIVHQMLPDSDIQINYVKYRNIYTINDLKNL